MYKNTILGKFWSESLVFCERKSKWAISLEKMSDSLICSFILSVLSKLLTIAHLSWVTWVIRSWWLFWHEWPEWFAHSHSYVLSDLSELLTVAHLMRAIWANERISNPALLGLYPIISGQGFCYNIYIFYSTFNGMVVSLHLHFVTFYGMSYLL